MSRHRVQLYGQNRSVEVDSRATPGAVVGVNLTLEDGTVVTHDMLFAQPPADQQPGGGLDAVYWRTIAEIPPNVTALAQQSGTGLYVLTGPGASATRTLTTNTLSLQNASGVSGDPVVDLPELPDTGGGALRKIDRDQYGRVSGTSEATTDDLPEGSNLYFTEQRARDASVADEIDPLITDVAPSQRAVAEALESVVVASETPEDGDILEYASMTGVWVPKRDPRQLLIDGGNF